MNKTAADPGNSKYVTLASGNPETEVSDNAVLNYIVGNLPLVMFFLVIVLIIYWFAGAKATFYFLILIVLGQLVLNGKYISELLKG